MELKGRHVLVTGANRGIGKSFAKMCAEEKSHLHIVVRKEDVELTETLRKAGAKSVTTYEVDLGQPKKIFALLEQLQEQTIDVVFNNAGQLTGGLLEEQSFSDIEQMLQVNVNAVIQITQGLLPGMLKRKRGKIINNSSVSAFMHFPCASTYAASKAAVVAFTNSLREELKGTGVTTLLLVTPGVKTRMFNEIEKLYGKNFEIPQDSILPAQYAMMIREAILQDLVILEPGGLTKVGLKVAQYLPPLFRYAVGKRFHRKSENKLK
jgi:short-subunit dehydrogenase